MKTTCFVRALKPSKIIFTLQLPLLLMMMACSTPQLAAPPESLDRQLINSLINKDIKTARKLLEQGANPEAILGAELDDHAVCTAIDDHSTEYLELLIEFGASPNAYWDVRYIRRRTPLACAIYLWNFDAFYFLLDNGADPSVDLYKEGSGKFRNSETALSVALSGTRYPMAWKLVGLYELHQAELDSLVWILENIPYSEAHPWNDARTALIEWTKARVTDFNPLAASPSLNGKKHGCLFMFRDHERGLKKGTLCPEPLEK